MYQFVIIFGFLLLGIILQYVKGFPKNAHQILNWIVIHICLPALALYYIPKIKWNTQLLYPILVTWIGFILSYLFFSILGKQFGWSRKLTGCLIITAGLGNTSFLGFPIMQALYGGQGLKVAILVDQPGTFVVLSTLGVLMATLYSSQQANGVAIAKKILFFPPFITFLLACFLNVMHYDLYAPISFFLQKTGTAVTPLALLSVGLQLHFDRKSNHWKFLGLGLLYKLVLTPAILYFVYVVVLHQRSAIIQVAIMEAAMAPMITGCILASSHGLKPRLCSMMVGFGIPISFITLFFWYFIVQFI
ncbi:AEC family transporter [Flavobacterium restrictum]|uniref:AEC family transporter n=1 Tax=Flavobacterium restrictum TaxID=2594428 RepID=A0A553E8L3_9FLAO|nr:AEC family transporter [Flavobacterium restrictum]TRX41399.1 AEC family transporter [Flavobacterium restrictum]